MGFVTSGLLRAAIEGLRGKHPLAVVVLPAMARAGVDVAQDGSSGTPYGSEDEVALLREFFQVPGGPSESPFYAVWQAPEQRGGPWLDDRYPGRSLQRMRTDRVKEARGFLQQKHSPGKDLWAL